MKKIIIAIDGYSSCGKSTLAKSLGDILHYSYISTGDMYRAVTLYLIENEIDVTDERAVKVALPNIEIHFENIGNGTHIFLNGRDVQGEIKKMYVSQKVSPVATISAVRKKMVLLQHGMGETKGIVMDGRDIGTVVFPKAELKIFLTADVEERTRRRYEEIKAKGQPADWEAVKQNLTSRDHIDSTRADSPLKQAEDAVLIDNTNLTTTEQLAMVKVLAECRMKN